ncbi:MAG: hypothetical protein K0S19_909 [Geminicoccaceae bacterium]|nr:hypothetical protein [Geminicoccaceae bacterium]
MARDLGKREGNHRRMQGGNKVIEIIPRASVNEPSADALTFTKWHHGGV